MTTDSADTVRNFLELLAAQRATEAVDLLDEEVDWRNTGLPTLRGAGRVGGVLRDMERRRIGFSAELHHVASDGEVVLTERTDVIRYGRFETAFWVCGTFRVREARIVLWHDHFSMGNVVAASALGLARAAAGSLPR
ncbi:MAG: limonene-1,2-epoxide hydrolase family protein [Marmoricola sp.]